MALFNKCSAEAAANRTAIIEFIGDDVDAEFGRLTDKVEAVHEPKMIRWGNRSVQFRDPEGPAVSLFMPVIDAAKERSGRARSCEMNTSRHGHTLDLEPLSRELGADYPVADFVAHSLCSKCDARSPQLSVRVGPRSRRGRRKMSCRRPSFRPTEWPREAFNTALDFSPAAFNSARSAPPIAGSSRSMMYLCTGIERL